MQVDDALKVVRKLVACGDATWAAVCGWGCSTAPVTWHGQPRALPSPAGGGEDDYIILVLPQDQYYLFLACGAGTVDPLMKLPPDPGQSQHAQGA